MKAYNVEICSGNYSKVRGVFSSKKKAEEYKNAIIKYGNAKPGEVHIIVMDMNEWEVHVDADRIFDEAMKRRVIKGQED